MAISGKIVSLKDGQDLNIFPETAARAVYMSNGKTLEDALKDVADGGSIGSCSISYEETSESILMNYPDMIEKVNEIDLKVEQKTSDYISLREFENYKIESTNDWTLALKNAFDYCYRNNIKELLIHTEIGISSTITIPNTGITIRGINRSISKIYPLNTMDTLLYKDNTMVSNITIHDIDFNAKYLVDNIINVEKAKGLVIYHCNFTRFRNSAIYLDNKQSDTGAFIYECEIYKNYIRGCVDGEENLINPDYHIYLGKSVSDNVIKDNIFANSKLAFINVLNGNNNSILNNHFYAYPSPSYSPVYFIESYGACVINQNYFDTPIKGIYHYGSDFQCCNNLFFWNKSTTEKINAIGIVCEKYPNYPIGKNIIANNLFNFGSNVTLEYDVKMDEYDKKTCYVEGNVSEATNKINEYGLSIYSKKILDDRNNRALNIDIFSNGDVYLKRTDTTNSDVLNQIILNDTFINITVAGKTLKVDSTKDYIQYNNKTYLPIQKGSSSPIGNVTPIEQCQFYLDTSSKELYFSFGTSNTDWLKLTRS